LEAATDVCRASGPYLLNNKQWEQVRDTPRVCRRDYIKL